MAVNIQLRRDTAANWTAANPTLSEGEEGHETDTNKRKVGDGVTDWVTLDYFNTPGTVVSVNGIAPVAGDITLAAADVGAVDTTAVGVAGGVASLDGTGKVPAGQLPSYVDDVIEVADYTALPGTGETGKIYVTLAASGGHPANAQYRWTGSVYVELVASPGTTSDVPEGSNLYFTAARVLATVLTGLSVATASAVLATDTVLVGIGKLQALWNTLAAIATSGSASDLTSGTVAAARLPITSGGVAQGYSPTAVKTANFAASAGDLVPCDATTTGFTTTLPSAPADRTRVCVKMIATAAGNMVAVACAGTDVFNKAGGAVSLNLILAGEGVELLYKSSTGIWYIIARDTPVAQLDLRYPLLNASGVVPAVDRHLIYANAPADVAGVVTLDLSADVDVWRLTLTKNITIAFSNVPAAPLGAEKEMIVSQDATGGWTLGWPAGSKYPDGLVPVQTAGASLKDRYAWYADALPTYTVCRLPNIS